MENMDTQLSLAGTQLDESISSFKASMLRGMEAIKDAAKTYVEALIKHPTLARERFYRECPTISKKAWQYLEAIGSGDLNPAAFLLPNGTADKMRHLPIETQDAMISNMGAFKVVNPYNGKVDIVPIQCLTTMQAELLFDIEKGKVRSEAEQVEIIEKRQCSNRKKAKKNSLVSYNIIGNVVIINGVEIGKNLLKRILSEMSNKRRNEKHDKR